MIKLLCGVSAEGSWEESAPTDSMLTAIRKCRAGIFSLEVLPDQLFFQILLAGNSGVTQTCPHSLVQVKQ